MIINGEALVDRFVVGPCLLHVRAGLGDAFGFVMRPGWLQRSPAFMDEQRGEMD